MQVRITGKSRWLLFQFKARTLLLPTGRLEVEWLFGILCSATIGAIFDGGGQGGAIETLSAYVPEESIGVEDALRGYTAGSAYARFSEDRLGTLEVGKEADLAVLSQNIFSVASADLAKTRVVMTMVGGKVVFAEKD